MNKPPIPIKLAMARVVARKILDNPGKFPDLLHTAKCFLDYPSDDYWTEPGNSHRWENDANYWQRIRARLPEILEKLAGE
jgi:hypothetical protein